MPITVVLNWWAELAKAAELSQAFPSSQVCRTEGYPRRVKGNSAGLLDATRRLGQQTKVWLTKSRLKNLPQPDDSERNLCEGRGVAAANGTCGHTRLGRPEHSAITIWRARDG